MQSKRKKKQLILISAFKIYREFYSKTKPSNENSLFIFDLFFSLLVQFTFTRYLQLLRTTLCFLNLQFHCLVISIEGREGKRDAIPWNFNQRTIKKKKRKEERAGRQNGGGDSPPVFNLCSAFRKFRVYRNFVFKRYFLCFYSITRLPAVIPLAAIHSKRDERQPIVGESQFVYQFDSFNCVAGVELKM